MSSITLLENWDVLHEADDDFSNVKFDEDDGESSEDETPDDTDADADDNTDADADDDTSTDDSDTDSDSTDSDDPDAEAVPEAPTELDIEKDFLTKSENSQQYLDYQKKMDLIKELRSACQELSDALGSSEEEKSLAYSISEKLDSLFERLEYVSLNFLKFRLQLRYGLLAQADSIIQNCSTNLNSLIEKSKKKD